jgi:CheY-like chemotaxis protein
LAYYLYPVGVMEVTGDGERRIVAVVADLVFGSKIRGAAQAAGVEVSFARTAEALLELAAGAALVLLDLETPWLDAPHVIAELKRSNAAARVIAFVPHVRIDAMEAARTAGADRVLARSAFVRELPAILASTGATPG